MQESWAHWMPLENLSKKYYIESITNNREGFTVLLADAIGESEKIKIVFENGVNAFRNTDETFKLSTISWLDEKYGGKFYAEWTFFRVENSEYLKFLCEQSGGISDFYDVKQYSIITDEEILDIAATYEPVVTLDGK